MTSNHEGIVYHTDIANLSAGKLVGFFEGWPASPDPSTLLKILRRSPHIVLALDGSSEEVVGFVNAISDGLLCAYIPLLEVRPAFRGRGIATELVRRILDQLRDLYAVDVCCDPELVPFYERFGMVHVAGMALRNREAATLSEG